MSWGIITILPFILVMSWSSNLNTEYECVEWEEVYITHHDCWTDNGVKVCGPVNSKVKKCLDWRHTEE